MRVVVHVTADGEWKGGWAQTPGLTSRNLFYPPRFHLLKVLEPPQIVGRSRTSSGAQAKQESVEGGRDSNSSLPRREAAAVISDGKSYRKSES